MSTLTRRQMLFGAAAAAPLLVLAASRASVALAATSPALVPAMAAKAVFDSYGVNTHFSFITDGSTWTNTDEAAQFVLDLRVSAVRQSLPRNSWQRDAVQRGMSRLTAAGMRWCCPVLGLDDTGSLADARVAVNEQLDWLQANTNLALLDSLPGPNEPNVSGYPNWAQQTRWGMQALWEETRKRSAFDAVKIQGSPLNMKAGMAVSADVTAVGDLSAWLDRGDLHIYPSDKDPEFQVDERLALCEPMHPGKPICVSEGGYTTAIGRGYTGGASLVMPDVAGLYAPRQAMIHALDGRKFFHYELLDEAAPYQNTDIATRESGFGFVSTPTLNPSSWKRKPAFDSMRRLMGLMRDPQVVTPVGLRVEVTATGTTLRSALMYRSDGKHLLAIWQAVDIYKWDRTALTGAYLAITPLVVTINLDMPTKVSVFEPSTKDTPVRKFQAQTFIQTLGAGMQVLQIG